MKGNEKRHGCRIWKCERLEKNLKTLKRAQRAWLFFFCLALGVGQGLWAQAVQPSIELEFDPVRKAQGVREKRTSIEMARLREYPFSIKNVSGGDLNLTGFSFTGTDAADFDVFLGTRSLITSSQSVAVPLGSSSNRLFLRYKADLASLSAKRRSAMLVVAHSGGGDALSVPLTAENAAKLEVTNISLVPPAKLDFGSAPSISIEAPLGGSSSVSLRVENVGSANAVFTNPVSAFGGAAASKFSAMFASTPLAPGETRDLVITYQPGVTEVAAASPDRATLNDALTSNAGATFTDGSGASSVNYDFSFVGVSSAASHVEIWTTNAPESTDTKVFSFDIGAKSSYVFYIKNVHTDPLSISEFSFTGRSASQFVISSDGLVSGTVSQYTREIAPNTYSPAFYVLYSTASSEGDKVARLSIQPSDGTDAVGTAAIVGISSRKAPVLKLKVQEGTVDDPKGEADTYGEGDFPLTVAFDAKVGIDKTITLTVSNEGSADLAFTSGFPFTGPTGDGDETRKYRFPNDWRGNVEPLPPGESISYEITYSPGLRPVPPDSDSTDNDDARIVLNTSNLSQQRFVINLVGTAEIPDPSDLHVYVLDAAAPNGEREISPTNEGATTNAFVLTGTTASTSKEFTLGLRNIGDRTLNVKHIEFQPAASAVTGERDASLFRVSSEEPTSDDPIVLQEDQDEGIRFTFRGDGTVTEKKALLSILSDSEGGGVDGGEFVYKILITTTPSAHTYKVYLGKEVVEPEALSFGETIRFVSKGLSLIGDKRASRDITVSNVGTGPLRIINLSINQEARTYYSTEIDPSPPFVVEPRSAKTFSVYYAPARLEGQTLGELSVVTEGTPARYSIKLTGSVSYAALRVKYEENEVPNTLVETSAEPQDLEAFLEYPRVYSLTLENEGNETLLISERPKIQGAGSDEDPVTFLETFPIEISPGGTFPVRLEAILKSRVLGGQSFSLVIKSNSNGGDYRISLLLERPDRPPSYLVKDSNGKVISLNGSLKFSSPTVLNPGSSDRGEEIITVETEQTSAFIENITFEGEGFGEEGVFSVTHDFSGDNHLRFSKRAPASIPILYAPTRATQVKAKMTLVFPGGNIPEEFVIFLEGNPLVPELEVKVNEEVYPHQGRIDGAYLLGDTQVFLLDVKNVGEERLLISSITLPGPEGVGEAAGFSRPRSSTPIVEGEQPFLLPRGTNPWNIAPGVTRRLMLTFYTKGDGVQVGEEEENINKARIRIVSNHNAEVSEGADNRPNNEHLIDMSFKVLEAPNLAVYYTRTDAEGEKRLPYAEVAEIPFDILEGEARTLQVKLRNLGDITMTVSGLGFERVFRSFYKGFSVPRDKPSPPNPTTYWSVATLKNPANPAAEEQRKVDITYDSSQAPDEDRDVVLRIQTDSGGDQLPERKLFELRLVPNIQVPTLAVREKDSDTNIEDGDTRKIDAETSKEKEVGYDLVNTGEVPILVTAVDYDPPLASFKIRGSIPVTINVGEKSPISVVIPASEEGEYKTKLVIKSDAGTFSLNLVVTVKEVPLNYASPDVRWKERTLSLLPNPAADGISYLRSDVFPYGAYVVYTLGGRRVLAGQLVSGKATLDLSAHPKGVYLVRLAQEMKKLIVD